jgi:elongation factor Ts
MHNSVSEGLGKIGVLVALETSATGEEIKRFGRMVAMHIAASNPQAVESSQLSAEVIRREKEVLADRAKEQGKAANVVDRIVESGLKTFFKEVCLVEQAYIHEPDKNVAQALKEFEGKVGGPIKITGYVRYALGEGIDRPDTDFAAEVAAAVKS